jgi:hypothetical protein
METEIEKALSGPEFWTSGPEQAYIYAYIVINGRFPEGEAVIAQNAEYAYRYAREVIKGRFIEGEAAIAQDAHYSYQYAEKVIKGRFPLAEHVIAQDSWWASIYYDHFKKYFTEQERVFWLLKAM